MKYLVQFSPVAKRDLAELSTYLTQNSGRTVARFYVARLRTYCLGFETFPHRGTERDDMPPGVRIVGFERSAAVAFIVVGQVVTIIRIIPRGMNLRIDG